MEPIQKLRAASFAVAEENINDTRYVLGLKEANSTEFAPETKVPVVSLLEEQVDIKAYGGTMRDIGRKCDSRPLCLCPGES